MASFFVTRLRCAELLIVLSLWHSSKCSASGDAKIDAEQDPYSVVEIMAHPSAPTSKLFASCLSAFRVTEVKFYTFETTVGIEYQRFVPDQEMEPERVVWVDVPSTEPVTDFAGCAEAAAAGGYPMFKYDGSQCLGSTEVLFNLNQESKCSADEQDAIFISTSAAPPPCRPGELESYSPGQMVKYCVFLVEGNYLTDEATAACGPGGQLTAPHGFLDNDEAVMQYVKDSGYQGDLHLGVSYLNYWEGLQGMDPVNTTYMVDPPPAGGIGGFDLLYISYSDNYLIVGGSTSKLAGGLCLRPGDV